MEFLITFGPVFFVSGPHAREITQVLVDYGADVNHHDDVWSTPLANRNLVEVCKFLLEQRADVTDMIHDIDQTTPLMLAIKRGLPELAHLILDQSPDVSPRIFTSAMCCTMPRSEGLPV